MNQRGFILPVLTPQIAALAVVALLILTLSWAAKHYYDAYHKVQAQFDAFVAQTKAEGEAAQAKADRERAEDDALHKQKDDDHAKQVAAIKSGWVADRADRDGLRKQLADSGSRAVQPVSIAAGVSCDQAGRDAVSRAVSGFVGEARSALAECRSAALEFRDSVAGLLEQAEVNTSALSCGIDWADKERGIHR